MGKKDKKVKETSGPELMQAFLKVDCTLAEKGGKAPKIVLRRASDESYTADLVKLDGVVVESNGDFKDEEPWADEDSWRVCSMIADVCRAGHKAQAESPQRSAFCEHLAYAYSILCDYVKEFDDDYTMSKETAETLIRGAIDRIVMAGKCFGFNLDKYRSDD